MQLTMHQPCLLPVDPTEIARKIAAMASNDFQFICSSFANRSGDLGVVVRNSIDANRHVDLRKMPFHLVESPSVRFALAGD